jgi:hypothetical protein
MPAMRDIAHRYRIVYWDSVDEKDQPVAPGFASAWLRSWLADPAHRLEVMEAYGLLGPVARRSRGWLDERDLGTYVHPAIERALHSGELVLVERAPIAGWKPAIFAVPSESAGAGDATGASEKAKPTKTWIEFLLQAADETPLEGFRYEAVLPDGTKKKGKSDQKGLVRFEEIEAGVVQFLWPDLDESTAWLFGEEDPPPAPEAVETDFVEFLVENTEGNPMPELAYEVTLSDGSVRRGRTGGDGRLRLNGVPKGEFEVVLRGLDPSA